MVKGQEIIGIRMTTRAATIFAIIESLSTAKEVLDSLGVCGNKVFKKQPEHCPICDASHMATLELIGVSSKPLFWECEDCGSLWCREKRSWIEDRIEKLHGCWTNGEDWDQPDKDNMN
mgnify:CR=1 FL=1